ncbi:Tyrosine recombinase XerC [Dyella sp. AD56]|uniref:site-specific integrase n=1 Tax=Dyella sp. AD56 TaxID=1528744 RepID=UPI000CA955A1|nr:site-specific integrase [Dyella sp. AD56]PMQ02659.1 Tyrosine recombinase XerC [Dyella sp. AD56]
MAKDGSDGLGKSRRRELVLRTGMGNELVDYACKINPDGSASIEANGPEDHARAMEALAEMAKTMPAFLQREIPKANPEPEGGLRSVLEALGASLQQSLSMQTPSPAPPRPRAIGKSADAWLKSIEADTLKKTLIIKAAAINGFARHVGINKMLHEVQREDVHAWVEALRASGLQTPTLINKTSYLRGFFNWAVSAGAYPKFPKDENPAAGHVIYRKQEKKKRRAFGFKAFTLEQIQALYTAEALANLSEGARWGAVIGLYTGARVSEVGQLALVDFTTVDGVPCMMITDEGEGQSVKNEPSLRTIPIHPDLITLGLMERVERLRERGEKRLFPKIKIGSVNGQGDWLSKAYGRHIETVGITKPDKGKYGFHSLRKTAIQAMKSGKVPLEWRCAYVGHDLDEEHVEIYSGEYGPKEMRAITSSALHFGINLVAIRACLSMD